MSSSASFSERLAAAVTEKNSRLCVGLDPRLENIPDDLRGRAFYEHGATPKAVAAAFEAFGAKVLELVAPLAPVVKLQSAFYEALGPDGAVALRATLLRARELGLLAICDAKRGDIGSTAEAYAAAYLGSLKIGSSAEFEAYPADALTVSPFLGPDTLKPFADVALARGRGLFVLAKTSNPGSGEFQDLVVDGRSVTERVGDAVRAIGERRPCGYRDAGIVVGATYPEQLRALRDRLPDLWFLVPGVGAQGARPEDVRSAFDSRGLGAVVNSSRAVIYAHEGSAGPWEKAVERAARQTRDALNRALPKA